MSVCVSFRRYTRRRLWSDRDQIWQTHADSSPNGSELNTNQPRVTQGGFGGFQRVSNSKIWNNYQTGGPIGTKFGTRLRIHLGMDIGKTINPSITQGEFWGVLGGQKFKNLEQLPNGWTNWHNIWYTPADSSGNGHRQNN